MEETSNRAGALAVASAARPCPSLPKFFAALRFLSRNLRPRVQKVRTTPCTFVFTCFFTLWRKQFP